jgi:hypothetical protein
MQARRRVPDKQVGIAEVDVGLDADAARAKRLEKGDAAPVVVVGVNGNRDDVADKGLPVAVPYFGAVTIDMLAEPYVIRVIWHADEAGLEVLNPEELKDASVNGQVSEGKPRIVRTAFSHIKVITQAIFLNRSDTR